MLPVPALIFSVVSLLCAGLQLIGARWRDLGPLTVGMAGCAVVLALPEPDPRVMAAVAGAIALAAIAWARGGQHGVGRPDLDGLVFAGATLAALAVTSLRGRTPLDGPTLAAVAAGALGLLCLLATGLAMQRPRIGVPPTRWFGSIPIRGPDP